MVVGPTASGKSELAVKIARKYSGEIISADSRQVYSGLDIGSGKIAKREMRGVPHHLLSVASPKRTFTVAHYQKLGRGAIKKILKKGKLPIICGGTGLYIDALLQETIFPNVKPNLKLRQKLERLSTEQLFVRLKNLDSQRAEAIDQHNKRRLIRAIEIVLATGSAVPSLQHSNILQNVGMFAPVVIKIGIQLPREELKKRIRVRLFRRLKQGMVQEVRRLRKSGLSWERLDSFGLEYRYISRYLRGLISKDEMMQTIEKESSRYAKRQMTWWKRDKAIAWYPHTRAAERAVIIALAAD